SGTARTSGSASGSRTRTETSQPRQTETPQPRQRETAQPKTTETPKAAEPAKEDEHAGHPPRG
ncbi:MAG TPA: hypothetical protein VEQ60_27305, partial [Longimicrobium sp.]|nr:hypothetical protein [Longimicrobium sp.]